MSTNPLGDSTVPIYQFEWDGGSVQTTEEIPKKFGIAIENLATLGREDPECEVTLVGFEN